MGFTLSDHPYKKVIKINKQKHTHKDISMMTRNYRLKMKQI